MTPELATTEADLIRELRLAIGSAIVRSGYLSQMDDAIELVDVTSCKPCADVNCGCPGIPILSDAVWAAFELPELWAKFVVTITEADEELAKRHRAIDTLTEVNAGLVREASYRSELLDKALAAVSHALGQVVGDQPWARVLEQITSEHREVLELRRQVEQLRNQLQETA